METDFGEYLKTLIEKRGFTYRQLGVIANIDHGYISQIINGKAGPPSPKKLKSLARPLGVPYEDLMKAAGHMDIAKEDSPQYEADDIPYEGRLFFKILKSLPPDEHQEFWGMFKAHTKLIERREAELRDKKPTK